MSDRLARGALILLLMGAACSGKVTPAARPSTSPSSSPSPAASTCVGTIVAISFQCPLSEVAKTDVSGQGKNVKVTIQAGEGSWEPTYIKATPGAHVILRIESDLVSHTFTVDGLGLNELVPARETTVVSFTLPATGPLIFYCVPHRARGMQGAFYFS